MLQTILLKPEYVVAAIARGHEPLRGDFWSWPTCPLLSTGGYEAFVKYIISGEPAVIFLRSHRAVPDYTVNFNRSIVVCRGDATYPFVWLWVGMMQQDWQVNQFLEGGMSAEADFVCRLLSAYTQFYVKHVGLWSMRKQLIRSARYYFS